MRNSFEISDSTIEFAEKNLSKHYLTILNRMLFAGEVHGEEFIAPNIMRDNGELSHLVFNLNTGHWRDLNNSYVGKGIVTFNTYITGECNRLSIEWIINGFEKHDSKLLGKPIIECIKHIYQARKANSKSWGANAYANQ